MKVKNNCTHPSLQNYSINLVTSLNKASNRKESSRHEMRLQNCSCRFLSFAKASPFGWPSSLQLQHNFLCSNVELLKHSVNEIRLQ